MGCDIQKLCGLPKVIFIECFHLLYVCEQEFGRSASLTNEQYMSYRSHQTIINKSSVDHTAIHYAYATCFTAEKKMEIRDCGMGLLLIFLDYKVNSFLCISLNMKTH